jgi:hypothetical protein
MKDKNSRGIIFDVVATIKGTDTLNAISNEKTGYPLKGEAFAEMHKL